MKIFANIFVVREIRRDRVICSAELCSRCSLEKKMRCILECILHLVLVYKYWRMYESSSTFLSNVQKLSIGD